MSLEIIGAGFGRTGTASLKSALETLGYRKCHHMKEVFVSPRQIGYWDRASRGEPMDWEQVFEGFNAAVDWPSAAYYAQLAERYPEAKVILSVRDPEGWYRSVSETIYPLSHAIPEWVGLIYRPVRTVKQMILRTVWQGIFDGRFTDREHAIGVFNRHIEEVKAVIPPDRLLIHRAADGWAPLCVFLDKPVPDTPYPRVNEAPVLKRMVIVMRWIGRLPWLLALLLLITVLARALR
jgi:hypothetical protein